jgi:hypothetical protein
VALMHLERLLSLAVSSDGALTLMLVGKYLSGTTPVTVSLANFAGTGAAQVFQERNQQSGYGVRDVGDLQTNFVIGVLTGAAGTDFGMNHGDLLVIR